jgi:hypothetical protein
MGVGSFGAIINAVLAVDFVARANQINAGEKPMGLNMSPMLWGGAILFAAMTAHLLYRFLRIGHAGHFTVKSPHEHAGR